MIVPAGSVGAADLSARKRGRHKNLFIAERRLFIGFFIGNRSFLIARIIHIHREPLFASTYCNADCDACIAQPPVVPDVVQFWVDKVEKYTCEAPVVVVTVLSNTNPLVPPDTPKFTLGGGPAMIQFTPWSLVVPPGVVLHGTKFVAVTEVCPPVTVTSRFPLLSSTSEPFP